MCCGGSLAHCRTFNSTLASSPNVTTRNVFRHLPNVPWEGGKIALVETLLKLNLYGNVSR